MGLFRKNSSCNCSNTNESFNVNPNPSNFEILKREKIGDKKEVFHSCKGSFFQIVKILKE